MCRIVDSMRSVGNPSDTSLFRDGYASQCGHSARRLAFRAFCFALFLGGLWRRRHEFVPQFPDAFSCE
jgi:hypothetical protein